MSISAWIMFIFASVVLYGGLYVTVSRAVKSSQEDKKE
ncbi:MAG: MetS family NSS transporter small subunit [Bacillota bacterium]